MNHLMVIGIDYGNVTLVNTQSEPTVVGVPVVYACRFSGAKAGETLFNQPAMEEVMNICSEYATVSESSINIKNEGVAIGYNISLIQTAFNLADPVGTCSLKSLKGISSHYK
ncbi:hypothetical protein [Solitalea lacus]|uniref:hypothetical protein n=1 Tax=Solitalea lacus TaxID=2911172 RepID=UPI001EDB5B47|nr:hypothetical protein [Solitalea lacus]UKJ06246.1 hypothetical protein L2B55_11935 [Solitalea lacus]